jgi:hypothetical protein
MQFGKLTTPKPKDAPCGIGGLIAGVNGGSHVHCLYHDQKSYKQPNRANASPTIQRVVAYHTFLRLSIPQFANNVMSFYEK